MKKDSMICFAIVVFCLLNLPSTSGLSNVSDTKHSENTVAMSKSYESTSLFEKLPILPFNESIEPKHAYTDIKSELGNGVIDTHTSPATHIEKSTRTNYNQTNTNHLCVDTQCNTNNAWSASSPSKYNNNTSDDGKTILYIGGIFPMSGGWAGGQGCRPAAQMALQHVNERDDILPGYHLEMIQHDSEV